MIGIDPGYGRVGWGVVDEHRHELASRAWGCIETAKEVPIQGRILEVWREVNRLLDEWYPDGMAIETLYFSKDVTTAMQVAEVRGVIRLAAAEHALPVADATTDDNILVGMLGSTTPGPTPAVTTVATPKPIVKPTSTPWSEYQASRDWSYNPSKLGATSDSQVAWKWDFGDGGTSTSRSGVHRYTREGYWTVKLKVTYADGSTRSFSASIHTWID